MTIYYFLTYIAKILKNKRAYFDYEILDELEAGLSMLGAEVKALRDGRGSLQGAFVSIRDDEAWIKSWLIPKWKFCSYEMDERRERKLLLHKAQIKRWQKKMQSEQALTIVPLKVYFKKGKLKALIGLAKGKKQYDKRESIKKRESDRKMGAKLKSF